MYFVTILYLYNAMELIMLNASIVSISMYYKTFLMQSHFGFNKTWQIPRPIKFIYQKWNVVQYVYTNLKSKETLIKNADV